MQDFNPNMIHFALNSVGYTEKGNRQLQLSSALHFFRSALDHGRITRFKAVLLRRPRLDLTEVRSALRVQGSYYSGIETVDIEKIIGSEGRSHDFDLNFHPIRSTSRERWTAIAIAHLNGCPLPPVELVQVGDFYFVRDGHHRISVATTFGQRNMDAEVITLNVACPIPEAVACQLNSCATLQTG